MMVCGCCIMNYRSNYTGEERTTVFSLLKEKDLKKRWIRFVNRKDWEPFLDIYMHRTFYRKILHKYYIGKKSKRYRLAINMKPAATIFGPKKVVNKNSVINEVTSPISIPRRTPRKRLYLEDQYETIMSKNSVKDFICFPPNWYSFRNSNDHVLFYMSFLAKVR